MKRLILACPVVLAVVFALACGSGDKAPAVATRTPATGAARATPSPVPAAAQPSGAQSGGAANAVSLLLGRALTGDGDVTGSGSLGAGDPALEAYVLKQSDLPSGYRIERTESTRVSDGISGSGTADVAASIATSGQFDSGQGSMLMSMAMRFSDLQDLDKAFSHVNAEALASQLQSAGGTEYADLFKDVHTLPTGDLGDHATGVAMTMDLASLFGSIAQALGGPAGTPVALPTGIPSGFTIRMYIFARGSLAGAVMHIYAGAAPRGVDELALSRIVDGRLAAAR